MSNNPDSQNVFSEFCLAVTVVYCLLIFLKFNTNLYVCINLGYIRWAKESIDIDLPFPTVSVLQVGKYGSTSITPHSIHEQRAVVGVGRVLSHLMCCLYHFWTAFTDDYVLGRYRGAIRSTFLQYYVDWLVCGLIHLGCRMKVLHLISGVSLIIVKYYFDVILFNFGRYWC